MSYFSRLAEAETFTHLATVETQRRGTERAETVCAVNDGAEWIQGFIDIQRHDAVRILDFSHAAGYVAQVGQAVLGEGTSEFKTWLDTTLHELKHDLPDKVLQTLRDMQHEPEGGAASPETQDNVRTAVQYLAKRRAQMDYARFQAAGYPIGSGSVESGNKVVVEARMKGAGMHWARPHVDPLVALRDVLCSARWGARVAADCDTYPCGSFERTPAMPARALDASPRDGTSEFQCYARLADTPGAIQTRIGQGHNDQAHRGTSTSSQTTISTACESSVASFADQTCSFQTLSLWAPTKTLTDTLRLGCSSVWGQDVR